MGLGLKGKVVGVAGGSEGIEHATAQRLRVWIEACSGHIDVGFPAACAVFGMVYWFSSLNRRK
jgi:hypothetical protein